MADDRMMALGHARLVVIFQAGEISSSTARERGRSGILSSALLWRWYGHRFERSSLCVSGELGALCSSSNGDGFVAGGCPIQPNMNSTSQSPHVSHLH